MTITHDPGMQVVRNIHHLWNVDEEWTLWEERGFSWWAQEYRQRVWAELALDDDGFAVYKLCARTDFARNIDVAFPHFYDKLSLLGMFASTSAPVLDASHSTISLWTIMYLHQDIADWVTPFFAGLAIVQPIEAQVRAVEYSRIICGGREDTSVHPTSGVRQEGDDMLRTVELLYAPAGQAPSCWQSSGEFDKVAAVLNQRNCFATASADGLSAELPFGTHETSLLTVHTHEQHPQLGNGLLLRLHLAESFGQGDVPFTAALLNTLETRYCTRMHLIGSWCAAPLGAGVHVPAFVTFIPNVLYKPGLLFNLVMSMAIRARWAAAEIRGQSKEGSVLGTIMKRLRQLSSH